MKEIIKNILKKLRIFDIVKKKYIEKTKLTKKYIFEERTSNKEKVCFILAGYKNFLYEIVFKRIKKFLPDDIEICILSSGKYSKELSDIARENNWSYLSTKRNNVCLILNVAINLFKSAKYIYKIDEDMFITENFFDTLFKTIQDCKIKGDYEPGIVCPTIPINGFGHLNILKRFDLVDKYTEKFERPIYAAGENRMIENNQEVAKFFWGEKNFLPKIDEMNKIMYEDEFKYITCPIKFSIGAILFERKFWEEMNMLEIDKNTGMGYDEDQMCKNALINSKPIIVSLNSVVGHLSFGKQNETMKNYYMNNKDIFDI